MRQMQSMVRLAAILAFGLLLPAKAEVIAVPKACDTPADLAPEPGIAAADLAGQTVKLPRIAIDVKRAVRLPNRTFAEALLAQVTVDPVGGRVSLGSDGQLVASSQPQPCE